MAFKIVTILLIVATTGIMDGCNNQDSAATQQRVFDYEEILDAGEEKHLKALIDSFEYVTGNEIAIVTTPGIGKYDKMVDFAVEFGNQHGVGKGSENNGLVLVFSKTMRETFIATGYGAEKILKEHVVKEIIDSTMIPCFKDEAYFKGLDSGLKDIMQKWNGDI